MIRLATAADADGLLVLMCKLAKFEGYADRFAVTASDLIERGLDEKGANQFTAWIADEGGVFAGYAVVYTIPFTYDLRPTAVLKELFVDERARNAGLGTQLFAAVSDYARRQNARLLRWQVLPANEAAKGFYRREGCELETEWESWVLAVERIEM